jgi:cyclic di-GMP phosphodiesterase
MNCEQSKPRVLIIDDEKTICLLLNQRLLSGGFECRICTRSEEALQILSQEPFDAVISDLDMPGVSGFDLLKTSLRLIPHAPFLIMTGDGDIETSVAAMKLGASDYLLKPLNLDLVLASLERALGLKKLEVELEDYRKNLEQKVVRRTEQLQAATRLIETTYDETLDTLAAALDLRDNDTAGHSRRVTLYSLEIANAMGCAAELSKPLLRGALLHDIGKIGIPDSILLKSGKLTQQETEIMQAHFQVSVDLLNGIGFLAPAAEIVQTHHERFDGTGYPRGLVGENIPLGARIFSVADTFDAITSDRPYRQAKPFAAACQVISAESGKQFDPKVVDTFLSIPAETWDKIKNEVALLRVGFRRASTSKQSVPLELRNSSFAEPDEVLANERNGPKVVPRPRDSRKVLIAQSDPVSRRILESCMLGWGYEVVSASDGESALEALVQEGAPKLAILDWEMARIDGLGVVRNLRKRASNEAYTYSILLTSKGRKEDVIDGLEAGADDYLTKPFHVQELQARIRTGWRIIELQDQLIRSKDALRVQATHDPLTGILNRLGLMNIFLREMARAARRRSWISALMIDIDHFKLINDRYGHLTGDLVLSKVAGRISATVRGYDAIGRYGGEEFMVVLPDCNLPTAVERAEKLRQLVETDPIQTSDGSISVTISVGAAAHRGDQLADHISLLDAADQALYRAKADGRNCVRSSACGVSDLREYDQYVAE